MKGFKIENDSTATFTASLPEVLKLMKMSFTVNYADGTEHKIREGICLEAAEDGRMIFHNGTDRPEVLFASMECIFEAICRLGLSEQCEEYLNRNDTEDQKDGKDGNS